MVRNNRGKFGFFKNNIAIILFNTSYEFFKEYNMRYKKCSYALLNIKKWRTYCPPPKYDFLEDVCGEHDSGAAAQLKLWKPKNFISIEMCGVRERRVQRKNFFCGNEIYFSIKSCFSDRKILFKESYHWKSNSCKKKASFTHCPC